MVYPNYFTVEEFVDSEPHEIAVDLKLSLLYKLTSILLVKCCLEDGLG